MTSPLSTSFVGVPPKLSSTALRRPFQRTIVVNETSPSPSARLENFASTGTMSWKPAAVHVPPRPTSLELGARNTSSAMGALSHSLLLPTTASVETDTSEPVFLQNAYFTPFAVNA